MTDYSCGAAFCDDPACIIHGAKDADGELKWRPLQDGDFTWKHKSPQDILVDINTLLCTTVAQDIESTPSSLWLPVWSYWWLKHGMIDLLLRSRRGRRPKRFTRK